MGVRAGFEVQAGHLAEARNCSLGMILRVQRLRMPINERHCGLEAARKFATSGWRHTAVTAHQRTTGMPSAGVKTAGTLDPQQATSR